MKQSVLVLIISLLSIQSGLSQKYFTKTASISFFSDTKMEKIEGLNKSSNCVLDLATGKLEFAALIKGFQFDKALMQEHFNENYMESTKFPKATFKGQIDNYTKIDPTKNGKTMVKVSGDLTLHGITKKVTTDANVEVKDGKVLTNAVFNLVIADYGVTIPTLVKDQIAKTVKVTVAATLEALKK